MLSASQFEKACVKKTCGDIDIQITLRNDILFDLEKGIPQAAVERLVLLSQTILWLINIYMLQNFDNDWSCLTEKVSIGWKVTMILFYSHWFI